MVSRPNAPFTTVPSAVTAVVTPFTVTLCISVWGLTISTWPLGPAEPPSLLSIDPPDHNRIRKLVTRSFSAKAISSLRGRTEQIAAQLLADLETRAGADRRTDVISGYASLLPATVITEMLGAPVEMREKFLEWGEGGAYSLDMGLDYATFHRSERDIDALTDWMAGHFERLRREPNDSILSSLVAAYDEEEGRLTHDELLSLAMLLLAAGFETTVNLIGNGMLALLRDPGQHARLRADPDRVPQAVEEFLRYDGPVNLATIRFTDEPVEYSGVTIPAGEVVLVSLIGANRDPGRYPDPQRFDPDRDTSGHLAFGYGIHHCLGASLARMEGEEVFNTLLARCRSIDARFTEPEWRTTLTLRGLATLPVEVTA